MKGELLKEFLSRILVEDGPADELNDIEITYTDKDGKERKAKVISIRKKGSEHPAWPQYQALLQQRGIVDTEPAANDTGTQQVPQAVKPLLPAPETPTDTQQPPESTVDQEKLTTAISGLESRSDVVASNEKIKQALSDLIQAIKSGDRDEIKRVVDLHGFSISKGGMPQFKTPAGSKVSGDIRKLGFKKGSNPGRKLASVVKKVLGDLGVSVADESQKAITSEGFKQNIIYPDDLLGYSEVAVDVADNRSTRQVTINGVSFGRALNPNDPGVTERIEGDLRERFPNASDEEIKEKMQYYVGALKQYNTRLRMLGRAATEGNLKTLPRGQEGIELIRDQVNSLLVDENGSAVEELQQAFATLSEKAMGTKKEFDSAWADFYELARGKYKKLFGDGSLPILAEHITSIYKLGQGRDVHVIMNENFRLFDVISTAQEPHEIDTGMALIDNIELLIVQLDPESVKVGTGGSATVGSLISVTQFNESTNGHPERKIRNTLNALGASPSPPERLGIVNLIHSKKTMEEIEVLKKTQLRIIQQFMPEIRKYYNFPDDFSDEQVTQALSQGRRPCGGMPTARDKNFETECPPGEPISEVNTAQLELYSLCGFAFEAIYGALAQSQAFTQVNYKTKSTVQSDGISTLALPSFQFNKQMKCNQAQGVVRDEGMAAHLKPSKRKNMDTCKSR